MSFENLPHGTLKHMLVEFIDRRHVGSEFILLRLTLAGSLTADVGFRPGASLNLFILPFKVVKVQLFLLIKGTR